MNLRSFQDTDIALMERWLYTPHVAKWCKHPDHWLRELRERHGEFSFLTHFVAEHEGIPIGFCQYYDTFFAQEHEVWNDEPDIGGKIRRGGGRTRGPAKRTKEDDARFETTLERLLDEANP